MLVASLDTGSNDRRLVGLGIAAVMAVAAAMFGVAALIQSARPQPADADQLTPNTAAETDLVLQLPRDFVQYRHGARYDLEGIDPPLLPFDDEGWRGTITASADSCGPATGVGAALGVAPPG